VTLDSIFAQIAEACLVLDSAGCITFANEAAARLIGKSPKALIGAPVPQDSQHGLPFAEISANVSKTRQHSHRTHRCSVTQRTFQLVGLPAGDAVLLLCWESASLETSSSQETDHSAAIVQEVTRELDSLSYTVSHDLRAPLRHIEAFGGLLEQSLAGKLDSASTEYLGVIIQSAQQMGQLLDGVLSYSRISRRDINRATVSLDQVFKAVLQELKLETEGRQIQWHLDPLPEVEGDPWMIRQCMVQLISNALKFTRGCPQACIRVGASRTATETILRIEDNGVGFDMQYVDRLFGLFQRLHSDPQFAGRGIGLAHVRRMIQRQGGRVWAEGKPGAGATFFIAFPNPSKGQHT
jgi:light-regulated signal transduction histidine kinase (bacteriophytochrome)